MRVYVLALVSALALAGCGSSGSDAGQVAKAAGKCTDRFFRAVKPGTSQATETEIRHYARVTYCEPFARKGWVYNDGSLSINAQRWLVRGGRCSTSAPGGASKTVPCRQLDQSPVIDCGILHFVRRGEVQKYIAALRRHNGDVRCDDGTPPAALGVP